MQQFTGMEYLMIDIANSYGLDKKNYDIRIQWVKDHMDRLEELNAQAESPAMYYAGVQALRKAQRKEPIGYPIGLDATVSGVQWISTCLGDKTGMYYTNVTSGSREDLYTHMYQEMCKRLGTEGNIARKDVKKAIMTFFYGSKATPKRIFGEGKQYQIFQQVMREQLPKCTEFMEVCLDLWNPNVDHYDWTMPDNFHCHVDVEDTKAYAVQWNNAPIRVYIKEKCKQKTGRAYGANVVHSIDSLVLREVTRRCMYNPQKVQHVKALLLNHSLFSSGSRKEKSKVSTLWEHYERTGFLSARIIDYITLDSLWEVKDPNKVLELINKFADKPFEVTWIHDCARCLPNHGNELRRVYKDLLIELHNSNVLLDCLSQMCGRQVKDADRMYFSEEITAEYAIC